jgi:hypothetical protein
MRAIITLTCIALFVTACAPPAPAARRMKAEQTANVGDLRYHPMQTQRFLLSSWRHIHKPGEPVTIYIEGDGFAWESRDQPSSDPTPIEPVALRLAALDPAPNVVYLARPCQFEGMRSVACERTYWTNGRFSREVIAAYDDAISQILTESKATKVHLIGYSGGGSIALLVAAGRDEVLDIRTIAGNLDHKAWTDFHRISPLNNSANPAEFTRTLSTIPQLHFVGSADEVMPRVVADAYRKHFANPQCVGVKMVDGSNHSNGWVEQWPNLLTLPVKCSPK